MVDFLLILVQIAAVAAPAAALVVPRWRVPVARGLLALGVLAAVAAPFGGTDGIRTLAVVHYFAAYAGQDIEVHPFPVEEVTAPSWQWGLVALLFCLLWASILHALRPDPENALARRRLGHRVPPFLLPLLLAWTAIALKLTLEKTAAPAALVAPVGWERALVAPSIAAAILLGYEIRRLLLTILALALFVTCSRLPIALFGTLATVNEWGTSLDVHGTEQFANPFIQLPVEVAAGSTEQLAWLLWAPHLIVFPSLYMLSLIGVAFAVVMVVTHPPEPAR